MFKPGDVVTGIDRSYKRSIYVCVECLDSQDGMYKPIAYSGRVLPEETSNKYLGMRSHSEFRFASKIEIIRASTRSFESLCSLLSSLGIKAADNVYV